MTPEFAKVPTPVTLAVPSKGALTYTKSPEALMVLAVLNESALDAVPTKRPLKVVASTFVA